MVKMVVSSFYNCLIDDEEAISSSTMLEIEKLRNKGIIFTVCTNRDYREVLEYNRDFPFIDYIVSLNGSCVYDVLKKRCFSKRKISISNLKKIKKYFNDYERIYYTLDGKYNDEIIDKEIYKIEILVNDEDVSNKLEKINGNFSYFNYHDKRYLEISSVKCNMFTGVDQVGIKNSINLGDILVVCSNESDYSLVRNIKNTYITKNGSKILKKETRRRTDTNNNKGLERIIKKI